MKSSHSLQPGDRGIGSAHHSPASQRRASMAIRAFRRFVTADGTISADRLNDAARSASIATGRMWSTERCRQFAAARRFTPSTRQHKA